MMIVDGKRGDGGCVSLLWSLLGGCSLLGIVEL